jgi:class 3 adenylate cyclase
MKGNELLGCSEARLWRLIEERAREGADVDAIDRRIWDLFGDEWAVMFTDLSGFSRQVETFGILHFLQVIFEHKRLLEPVIDDHDGILIKVEADSLLILFKRPDAALKCGIEMQRALAHVNRERPPDTKIMLCVGIGYGRILRIGDVDVYGREVNAASKLGEDTARPGEILVTAAARDGLVSAGVSVDGARAKLGAVECTLTDLGQAVPGSAVNFRVHYTL